MVNQHTVGIDSVLHTEGCLFLVYLWAGWLWRAAGNVPAHKAVQDYDVGHVNAMFGEQKHLGNVGDDATVVDPVPIIRAGGAIPEAVPVDVQFEGGAAVTEPGKGAAVTEPGKGPFVVDAVRYTLGNHQHFIGRCLAPDAYYDPWIASLCVAGGHAPDLRRVTIGAAHR